MVRIQSIEEARMEADKIKPTLFIISVSAVFSVETIIHIAHPNSMYPPLVVIGATRVMEMLLIVGIILIRGERLAIVGLEPSGLLSGAWKGLVWSAVFGLAVAIVGSGLILFGIKPIALIKVRLPDKSHELFFFFLVGGMVGPMAEELFFRGIIYGYFRRWGVLTAVFVSALLFSLAHFVMSGAFFIQMIGGIVFAAAYEREKCLLVPVVIHVLGNLAIFSLSLSRFPA